MRCRRIPSLQRRLRGARVSGRRFLLRVGDARRRRGGLRCGAGGGAGSPPSSRSQRRTARGVERRSGAGGFDGANGRCGGLTVANSAQQWVRPTLRRAHCWRLLRPPEARRRMWTAATFALRSAPLGCSRHDRRRLQRMIARRLRRPDEIAQPLARRVRVVLRNRRFGMHAQHLVEHLAPERALIHRIDDFDDDGNAGDGAHRVRRRENLVRVLNAMLLRCERPSPAASRCGKSMFHGMRRNIRTLGHETHVTQVTVIHDLPVNLLVHAIELARRRSVDRIEQRGKRIAQAEAAATAVADVEDALQLFLERRFVVERGILPVEGMPGRAPRDSPHARRTRMSSFRPLPFK